VKLNIKEENNNPLDRRTKLFDGKTNLKKKEQYEDVL